MVEVASCLAGSWSGLDVRVGPFDVYARKAPGEEEAGGGTVESVVQWGVVKGVDGRRSVVTCHAFKYSIRVNVSPEGRESR